jgi:hypothetical protein
MNEPDVDRAEAIRQIATILATAYLRLRFSTPAAAQLDSCGRCPCCHGPVRIVERLTANQLYLEERFPVQLLDSS